MENDWENYFGGLFFKISHLSKFFEIDENILLHYCSRKIHLLRSLKYSTAFFLGRKELDSALIKIDEFSVEVQKLFYYSLFSNPFMPDPKYFYLDLIYSCQELTFTLVLLMNSPIYEEKKAENHENFIKLTEFFVFFGMYYLGTTLESWILVGQIANELCDFLKQSQNYRLVFSNQNNDYIQIFSSLRLMTENFSNFKQKNKKLVKNEDIYSELFSSNPHEEPELNQKCSKLDENDYKTFLFKIVIKYLSTIYLKENLKPEINRAFEVVSDLPPYDQNQFTVENILTFIDGFEEKSYKALKTIFNKFGAGELSNYLEEIKKIIKV